MYVKVMAHPICKSIANEVLFSSDGKSFQSVDGLTEKDLFFFEEILCVRFYDDSPIPFRLLGKELAEKIKMLKLHVKYKDEKASMKVFYELAKKLVDIQSRTEEDLKIPEVVEVLSNTPLSYFV